MSAAWFCNSGEDDNTKTPKIVSLIELFIFPNESKIDTVIIKKGGD